MAENISPRELLNRFQNNDSMRIIDVRTPAEFSTLHVRNVENIPLDRLETASLASSPGKELRSAAVEGGSGDQGWLPTWMGVW